MIDLLTIGANLCEVTGGVRSVGGVLRLAGYQHMRATGTASFPMIAPPEHCRWMSAELRALSDLSTGAVKLRFYGEDAGTRYYDDETGTFEPVTADDWDTQFSWPHHLQCLESWTSRSLQVILHLERVEIDRDPRVTGIAVIVDIPAWEGAVLEAVRAAANGVASCRPVLVHEETLSAVQAEWVLGAPRSEHGFTLYELIEALVNGEHRSATLSDGVVTLKGTPPGVGDAVKIAVTWGAPSAHRRPGDSSVVFRLPSWVFDDPGGSGTMSGLLPVVHVGGVDAHMRRSDVTIPVRGVAARVADAHAMRAALASRFAEGLAITLRSGRVVYAVLDDRLEIATGPNGFPEAQATIRVQMTEASSYTRVRQARQGTAPTTTSLHLSLGPTGEEPEFDITTHPTA